MTEHPQLTIDGRETRPAPAQPPAQPSGQHEAPPLFTAPQTIRGQLAMTTDRSPAMTAAKTIRLAGGAIATRLSDVPPAAIYDHGGDGDPRGDGPDCIVCGLLAAWGPHNGCETDGDILVSGDWTADGVEARWHRDRVLDAIRNASALMHHVVLFRGGSGLRELDEALALLHFREGLTPDLSARAEAALDALVGGIGSDAAAAVFVAAAERVGIAFYLRAGS